MYDPLDLTQVLCTRLCHDLAGPIGAVAAGVELVGGDPSQVDAETLALIASSSAAASRKLKLLRLALGTTGGGALKDLQATVAGYFDAIAGPGGPAKVTWSGDLGGLSGVEEGRGAQVIANVVLAASEVVPRLREVAISVATAGAVTLSVTAAGDISGNLDPRRALTALLADPASVELTPKTVQALFAHSVVSRARGQLSGESVDGGYRITVRLP